jgi:hypothetical protein
VERPGVIHIIDGKGEVLPEPFLDIDSKVIATSGQSERGLLGLAFHPDYANNGYFYVNYIANDGNTRVSRFSVDPGDPDKGDPNSELQLMTINQPFSNHNGGDLNFGPDGYLYIGMGDGGSANDPQNNSQNRQSWLGKMLRIDVDNGMPYAIPPDNPFADDDFTLDEIWALGLRNPWRFSFDRETGDMWIADVGQNEWEEVDFQPANSLGGENYGWRCYEADDPFITSGCEPSDSMTFPVAKYPHPGGFQCASITGGYVYRGSANPDLYGWYLYGDFCFQEIWGVRFDGSEWEHVEMGDFTGPYGFITFGEDEKGEMYTGTFQGNIYRIRSGDCASLSAQTSVLDDCDGQGIGEINIVVNGGTPPYTLDPPPGLGYEAGDYLFTITDALGCEYEVTASVQNNQTPVNIPEIEFNGDLLTLEVPDTFEFYQWYLNEDPLPGADESVYQWNQEFGCFTVELGDADNCTAETSLYCIDPEAITSIENNELFQLYPNPAKDRIYMASKESPLKNLSMEIIDTQGRQTLLVEEQSAFLQKEINLSTLTPGMYLVKIRIGEEEYSGKLIISK